MKKTDKNEKGKQISELKQNKPSLKFIVIYHDMNQDGEIESSKGC